MKQESDFYDDSENDKRLSVSKNFVSRQIFGQHNRNKRRMHTNSILNELRLNQKINQGNFLVQQQKSLKRFQNSRKNSINGIRSRNRLSDCNIYNEQNYQSHRVSNFFQSQSKNLVSGDITSNFALQSKREMQNKAKKQKEEEKSIFHQLKKKIKNPTKQPRNLILSSINNKLRQLDVISKTFDKVNEFYAIDYGTGVQNYTNKPSQTFKILKDFESKLTLRKNKITERKNSFKKNTKIEYRYKVKPKRYQTEASDKENSQLQNKFHGVWHQDARKLKSYISGGYTDEKEEYSEFCDIEEYRSLKKNFKTFEQIYNSIKQDKDNPIGKVSKHDFKQPNILQIVSAMEKQQQLDVFKAM